MEESIIKVQEALGAAVVSVCTDDAGIEYVCFSSQNQFMLTLGD